RQLKAFIVNLVISEGFDLKHINYIFCTDSYLLDYNIKYLHHSTLTDIITFQLNTVQEPIIADIFISVDRVKENALLFDSSFINEFHRVIFHGALHLCGYKDKTKMDILEMRNKEAFYLNSYFVPRETF
ncbi:MAG TPA: rRNA maturation RNase YbeY, partial [Chitinophagaceae bacterium]|nr:rRNA maturation RNase YbeY [Chitinophagaceae bacterium]